MCQKGTGADYQAVFTNTFTISQGLCSTISAADYITDVGVYDSTSNPTGYIVSKKTDNSNNVYLLTY